MCVINFILQVIGLVVVVWIVWIAYDEYMKVKQEENRHDS